MEAISFCDLVRINSLFRLSSVCVNESNHYTDQMSIQS